MQLPDHIFVLFGVFLNFALIVAFYLLLVLGVKGLHLLDYEGFLVLELAYLGP